MSNPDQWSSLKGACRRADMSVHAFALSHGVTWSHLYRVVHGERKSPRLSEAVKAFIEAHPE